MKVPLFIPWITNEDIRLTSKSYKLNQLTDGPILKKFEKEFSKLVGCKFAIGLSNGTSALHLSLLSLGIRKGDEVLVPDLTFIATANAVVATGAKPVFVDVDETLNISTKNIKTEITRKTRAIIPVHFAGFSSDMDTIMKIAKKNNIFVIEDCAHSLGTFYKNKHVGTIGNIGCFSFYPTKNITTIEGGMAITNSKKISNDIQSLRNHGINKNLQQRYAKSKPWEYDVSRPGYNYRLDEIRSSLGLSQLRRFKKITKKRIDAAKYYTKKLKNIKGIEIMNLKYDDAHVYHLYIIRIKKEFGVSRDQIHKFLWQKGIYTTVHYKPLHKFSCFNKNIIDDKKFPNSMNAYKECLTLPLFPTINRKQQEFVITNLLKLKK